MNKLKSLNKLNAMSQVWMTLASGSGEKINTFLLCKWAYHFI